MDANDPDPFRSLWHAHCRKMWEHDERLSATMQTAADKAESVNHGPHEYRKKFTP